MSEIRPDWDKLRNEAAMHVARANAIGVAAEEDAALIDWRQQDRAHEIAFAQINGAWDGIADLSEHPALKEMLGAPTWRERWIAWRKRERATVVVRKRPQRLALASLVLALVASMGLLAWNRFSRPDYATQIAQTRQVRLSDGSLVTLGAKSALKVDFDPAARRVRLAGGEAFFSISKNPSRPFIVEAGETRIRVVGTKFNVNYAAGRVVRVSVLEGVVEVMRAGGWIERIEGRATPSVRITATQQAVDAGELAMPRVEPIRITDPGAWREGRLGYQDAPLVAIVADINRYRPAEVRIASDALGAARLTTSFKVSQIDMMLQSLPNSLPLRVRRNGDGTIDLQPL